MRSAVLPVRCSPTLVLGSHKTNICSSDSIKLRTRLIGDDGYHFNKFVDAKLNPSSVSISIRCFSSSQGASSSSSAAAGGEDQEPQNQQKKGFWEKWRENSGEMSSKIGKLGLSAVLAYGLFDGVTYTTFFLLAFLGYEKSTGKNPAANLQALLGIVILMWTGNNVTRPFRVAGAAALAPVIDVGLRRVQRYFNFPSLVYAFALVVGVVAASCLTIVGLLILSRWGK